MYPKDLKRHESVHSVKSREMESDEFATFVRERTKRLREKANGANVLGSQNLGDLARPASRASTLDLLQDATDRIEHSERSHETLDAEVAVLKSKLEPFQALQAENASLKLEVTALKDGAESFRAGERDHDALRVAFEALKLQIGSFEVLEHERAAPRRDVAALRAQVGVSKGGEASNASPTDECRITYELIVID